MIVVDGLLAEQDEAGLLARGDGVQRARYRQRLERGRRVDADRAIGAHRQPRAQLLLGFDGTDRHEHARASNAPDSLRRNAASIAISSNGLMLILSPSVAMPEPSGFTRTRTL